MPDFAHKGTVPCTVPVVVGTKERRKERGSKGKFVCVFRGSTKFKASDRSVPNNHYIKPQVQRSLFPSLT